MAVFSALLIPSDLLKNKFLVSPKEAEKLRIESRQFGPFGCVVRLEECFR